MVLHGINFASPRVAAILADGRVRRAWLFGSILTERFTAQSDIDLLIETDPIDPPGLFVLGGVQMNLSELFGRQVHLTMLGGIPVGERARALLGARLLHAA